VVRKIYENNNNSVLTSGVLQICDSLWTGIQDVCSS